MRHSNKVDNFGIVKSSKNVTRMSFTYFRHHSSVYNNCFITSTTSRRTAGKDVLKNPVKPL